MTQLHVALEHLDFIPVMNGSWLCAAPCLIYGRGRVMSCTNLPWAPGAWSEAGTEILLSTQPEEQGPHWEPSINHALSSALQGKSCLTEGHGDSCHMLFGLAVGTPLCPVDEGALSLSRQTFQLPAGGHPFPSCMHVCTCSIGSQLQHSLS